MKECRENIIETLLMEEIRNYLLGETEFRYNQVLAEFREYFSHPLCGRRCYWRPNLGAIREGIHQLPRLVRSTHQECPICHINALSEYSHAVCHECAKEQEYPMEFAYHHRGCRR